MRTQVIHSRIDLETLVSVIEFYNLKDGNEKDPLSTKVSLVLNSIMFHLRESGQIPTHPVEDIEQLFNQYVSKSKFPVSVDINVDNIELRDPTPHSVDVPEASLHKAIKDSEDPRERLREMIDSSLHEVTQPSPELDPSVWTPDPDTLPDAASFNINIDKQPKLELGELPPRREEVLVAMAMEDFTERDIQLLSCQIIFALDMNISAEAFEQLAAQLRPHIERYLE